MKITLTQEQAQSLIHHANSMSYGKDYRFGQALTNLLPNDLYLEYNGTELDFFHWTDYDEIIDTFYKHYVL